MVAATVAAAPAPARAAACAVTLAESLKPTVLARLQELTDEGYRDKAFTPNLAPPPKELASTANETLPVLYRTFTSDPQLSKQGDYYDNYFGNDYKSSADVFVLPLDDRALCQLLPLQAVFLSDGATHHYAEISRVDYQHQTITLNDEWADVSFLRDGYNIAGVKGIPLKTPGGKPQLQLTFEDFVSVLRGRIFVPVADPKIAGEDALVSAHDVLRVIERLYPEVASSQDYLLWKYSRMLTALGPDFLPAELELGDMQIPDSMPRLEQLQLAMSDLAMGAASNFEQELNVKTRQIIGLDADPKARVDEWQDRRNAFIDRLDGYATAFNWPLKRWLIFVTRHADDALVHLAVTEKFLAASPDDLDLQIARTRSLLDLHHASEARDQLAATTRAWRMQVAAGIDLKPEDKAVAYFWASEVSPQLESGRLMLWRWAQIRMLEAIAALEADPSADVRPITTDLNDRYKSEVEWDRISGYCYDFLSDCLWMSWLSHDGDTDGGIVKLLADFTLTPQEQNRIADAVFEHAKKRRSILDLDAASSGSVGKSSLKAAVCKRWSHQPEFTPMAEDDKDALSRLHAFDQFCRH